MQTVRGKRALITGAASGIGKAIAEQLGAEGAELLLVDVNEAAVHATAAALGPHARPYVLDVTDTSRIIGLRDQIHRDGGPVDLLVNNAGLVFGGAFLDMPLEKHLTTYRVNTLGLVAMTHAFLPDLIAGSDGHVVNIASASAFIGLPFGTTYASSKWAVLGFSESLMLELELQGHHHVHVSVICPSYVATRLFHGARAPLFTQLLTAERVAELTVRAILGNKTHARAPWLAQLTPILKGVMPFWLFARTAATFGVNTSMLEWRGRGPTA